MNPDLLPITTADMIEELQREIALRQRLYPRWVSEGKLMPEKAARQIEILQAIVLRLEALQAFVTRLEEMP
jgi:hypothetical protein